MDDDERIDVVIGIIRLLTQRGEDWQRWAEIRPRLQAELEAFVQQIRRDA